MPAHDWCDAETRALFRAVLALRTPREAASFFRDLLTDHELQELRNRWLAVRLLDQGVPYKAIESRTGMSSRTLARIARWMRDGQGGYRMMLRRIGQDASDRSESTRRARGAS